VDTRRTDRLRHVPVSSCVTTSPPGGGPRLPVGFHAAAGSKRSSQGGQKNCSVIRCLRTRTTSHCSAIGNCRSSPRTTRAMRMNLSVNCSSAVRVMQVLARAVACGLLLVLPACAIPQLRVAEPAPVVPGDFCGAASADNVAFLGVKEFYNDPTLVFLIE